MEITFKRIYRREQKPVVWGLLLSTSTLLLPTVMPVEKIPPTVISHHTTIPRHRPMKIDVTSISGQKLGSLPSWYLGGIQPHRSHVVDFDKSLEHLWRQKLKIKGVTPATKKNVNVILKRYAGENYETMTVDQLIKRADHEVKGSHAALDWAGFCKHLSMNDGECHSIKEVTGSISGRSLVAYGMTEVMPFQNGEKNKAVLDILLQNAGFNYVNKIPALGDPLFSLGFYQFTSIAIRRDSTNVEGASVVGMFAGKGYKIADSVMNLRSNQQHRAAFYFATYNLARLVKRLNDVEQKKLVELAKRDPEGLVEFIATSHHMPTPCIQHAKEWIQKGGDYSDYLKGDLKLYSKKTLDNWKAL